MPREYRRRKKYETEILKLGEQGLTQKEIGERLEFRREEIKEFFKRYNKK